MYLKRISIAKATIPAAVLIAGSNLLQIAADAVGVPIGDEKSYMIVTAVYGAVRGLVNWFKNRRKR